MSADATPGASGTEVYTLQLGAFRQEAAARERAAEARAAVPGLAVQIRRQAGLARVYLGHFATRQEAEAALRALGGRALGPVWVTRLGP